jgi:hypothetical protein
MHHLRTTLLAALLTSSVFSQTNTFPTSGNVGIGTTNPASQLDLQDNGQHLTFLINKKLTGSWPASAESTTMTIQSSGNSTGNLAFATGNSEWMRLTQNGNVGIGTTSPSVKFHVKSDTDSAAMFESTENNAYIWLKNAQGGSSISSSSGTLYVGDGATQGIHFRTAPDWGVRMTVLPSGNVGIGTTSPATKLDINNSLRIAPYSSDHAGGYIDAPASLYLLNGNIYISTTAAGMPFLGLFLAGCTIPPGIKPSRLPITSSTGAAAFSA